MDVSTAVDTQFLGKGTLHRWEAEHSVEDILFVREKRPAVRSHAFRCLSLRWGSLTPLKLQPMFGTHDLELLWDIFGGSDEGQKQAIIYPGNKN